ncbi:MAG: hypothetical protein JXJ17_17060 [Anaerolineae bacterium]|nr:hypothetical protein [Anaerolineae bacterium]
MTWSDPESRDIGDLITAAIWNQDVVDNVQYLFDNLPGGKSCWVYNTADISWPTGTDTTMTFNSELWDTDDIHSTISNTDRLTAPQDGLYLVGASLYFNQPDCFDLKVFKNGSTQLGVGGRGDAGSSFGGSVVTIVDLAEDDYVVFKGYHTEGTTRLMVASGYIGIAAFMVLIGAKPT